MKEENKTLEMFSDVLAEEVKILEDGEYEGEIVDITRDTEIYDYTRYLVEIKNENMKLSLSFPTRITFTEDGTASSQHAEFLVMMGKELTKDISMNETILSLKGRKLKFYVKQKPSKKDKTKKYSEIVKDTIKAI